MVRTRSWYAAGIASRNSSLRESPRPTFMRSTGSAPPSAVTPALARPVTPRNQTRRMRTLVIGAGAVGQYLAARLRLGGHDVTLLARRNSVRPLSEHGIRLRVREQLLPVTVRATADPTDPILNDPFELVIVAVKAYSTPGAIDSLRAVRGAGEASIMSIQNGLGNEEQLASAFGEERIVAAALTTAAKTPE